jgi:prolipoprotein diacylglyceryltransferase
MIVIHETGREWVYSLVVGASLLFLFLFPTGNARLPVKERARYWLLQTITLLFAILGAKASMLWADGVEVERWQQLAFSGRSITGGLLGGFLAAEASKPLLGYVLPPNDRFAAKLPFSIALGRVGCLFGGCCRGLPHDGLLSIRYDDGVARWPTQLIELVFQLGVGLVFVVAVRRGAWQARVFNVYLVVYGAFRFLIEYLRETPKLAGSLSRYQLLSLAMLLVGAGVLTYRTRAGAERAGVGA